ncbi:MAG TPA: hypothetical protein VMG35_31260, partial [Bryobacteraceae bacterium]|nr:hypothetical protein [Bryobacteraceae bacterium]
MKLAHRFVPAVTVTAIFSLLVPCGVAQDAPTSGQATPNLSGTGSAGRIAVWKNSTTIGSSVISQSSGSIGINTKSPAATLEVNGNAQVDGNISFSGSILENGGSQLLWAPNDGSGNFSAGLSALPSTTAGTDNTVVGDTALHANTTGNSSTAVGAGALYSNTTGN